MKEERITALDIGEIIAAALAEGASTLGEVEDLVRGRTGSWEADIIRRMATTKASLSEPDKPYVKKLARLFIEMGRERVDGGDVLSQAMSQAVDALGGLDQFSAGMIKWWRYPIRIAPLLCSRGVLYCRVYFHH